MSTAIRLRSAVALLGRFPALAGVDLDVECGRVVLLRGPNGAGKTTLLRLCAGLVPLATGEGNVLGHDLSRDRRLVRAKVGLLGHAGALYDDLTVEDNVRFAAHTAHRPSTVIAPALARLGLDGRLGAVAVGRLSAGQRRRVALAALVARDPELWLLDEPHAGLDDQGRDVVDEVVREVVAAGATVLVASHDIDRATSLADRVVRIAGGHIALGERVDVA